MTAGRRFWVVGAGGIGCVFGARLAGRHQVTFVDTWAEHVDAMGREGLTVEYLDEVVELPVRAVPLEDLPSLARSDGEPDAVLLAVKSAQTEDTVRRLAEHVGQAPVVSLQNGLNEQTIARIVGPERTVGAVVRFNGRLLAPGRASQSRRGPLVVGEMLGGSSTRIERLAADLRVAGEVEISADIRSVLWSKLVLNCMINPVCGIADTDLAGVVASDRLSAVSVAIGLEAIAIATAAGVALDASTLYDVGQDLLSARQPEASRLFAERFRSAYTGSKDLQPSMLQDLRKGRTTEVLALNGAVAAEGDERGLPAPLNTTAVRLVRSVEEGRARAGPPLAAELVSAAFATAPTNAKELS